jgi:hypothetical protein
MDTSDLTTYPIVANTDCSPTNESLSYLDTFNKAYLADFYTTSPNHSLNIFLNSNSFLDRPVTSVEFPIVFNGANTSPNTMNAFQPGFSPVPFSQLD